MVELNVVEELKKVMEKENKDWFKAKQGRYVIIFLNEPEQKLKEFDGETKTVWDFDIETNGKRFTWTINPATTKSSLWGQLLLVANKKHNNKYTGLAINLLVKNDGKKNEYTIIEAVDLLNESNEDVVQ